MRQDCIEAIRSFFPSAVRSKYGSFRKFLSVDEINLQIICCPACFTDSLRKTSHQASCSQSRHITGRQSFQLIFECVVNAKLSQFTKLPRKNATVANVCTNDLPLSRS
ncbi:protein of unknown function [Cupriavidus neocaledonicus]|uniref:Uncharacterized protein n=1 Tax=Cupriavidus neocaledonicus TaxID=1040979 RepID=A0A375H8B0_9BURK|nr:protein of unknown function [Cupriavidus neocaledonicus]